METLTSPAARHRFDSYSAELDALAQAEAQIRQEIARGFAQLPHRPAATIAVPALVRSGTTFKEGADSVASVIADRMQEGRCMPELLQVLEHSSCPHVQQLREALGKSWAESWASDIAPHRAGL